MTSSEPPGSSKKVLVLGASGVAGRSVVPALGAAGHDVVAHVRSDPAARAVQDLCAATTFADVRDDMALRSLCYGMDVVIDLRSAVPHGNPALRSRAWRDYSRLRGQECRRVVECALAARVTTVIRDTVTVVYADGGDAVLTEDSPTRAAGPLHANLEAEAHLRSFTARGGRGIALRMAPFYGPDDVISRELLLAAQQGQARVLAPPDAWTSALHTDDIGSAVVAALDAPPGEYNVADMEPLRTREWLEVLAASVGRPVLRQPPRFLTRMVSPPIAALARSQRISADKFMRATGWRPAVESRRTGWPLAAKQLEGTLT